MLEDEEELGGVLMNSLCGRWGPLTIRVRGPILDRVWTHPRTVGRPGVSEQLNRRTRSL